MTIVCAVDASAGAREAVRVSARLGRRLGARVLAVHVVDAVAGCLGEEGFRSTWSKEVGGSSSERSPTSASSRRTCVWRWDTRLHGWRR
jgi:hypothetical protein